jgi:hypothetical protein
MNDNAQDAWQRCLGPIEKHWQRCRQRLRYAVVRRAIAEDVPLCLVPTIAAYLASEHEVTRTHIGIVTVPMTTTSIKNQTIHIHRGE